MTAQPSKLEARFDVWVLPLLSVQPVQQHRFHPTRRWRFDYAYPDARLAIEVDGGQYTPRGGRHNTDVDREKLNEAAKLGWRVLRYSGAMLKDPARVAADIEAARLANILMPCGHPRSAVVSADEGTAYCAECEREARETAPHWIAAQRHDDPRSSTRPSQVVDGVIIVNPWVRAADDEAGE